MASPMRPFVLVLLGSLLLVTLANPAHAASADCGASVQGPSALAGGSCDVATPAGSLHVCAEALTSDGYTWGFDVAGVQTVPGCEADEHGAGGCQTWADQAPGPYPNEGVDCRAPILTFLVSPRVCVEGLDGRWAFGFDVLAFQTTTGCGRGPAPQDVT